MWTTCPAPFDADRPSGVRLGDPLSRRGRYATGSGETLSVVGLDRAVLIRLATSERLERAVKTVPLGEAAAWRAASRYVAGRSRGQALATAMALLDRGHAVSVDLFGV
jgi:hypothetical protein